MSAHNTDWWKKVKVVLALAVPTVVENFLLTIVGFIDTLLVARLGLPEVAAVGVTNAVVAIYIALFMALGIGASSLIARSIGAGDHTRAGNIARQSAWLAVIAGLVLGMVTFLFAEPLLIYMGIEAEVLAAGVVYFKIVAVPSVVLSLLIIFGNILRSAGDTKSPLKVGLAINLLHVGLAYVLIFGFGSWNGWGIAGAAWATTISRLIGVVALYACIQKSKAAFSLFAGKSGQFMRPLLQISGPAMAERLIMRLGQLFYAGLIVRLGTDVYSAFIFGGNISAFSFMPGYGFAVAATTLVGNQMGADCRQEAYRYGIVTMWLAVIFMGLIGVVYFVFAAAAGAWFTNDQQMIDMVIVGLRIDAFAQPFIAVSLVIAGALQGAGDTKSPMYSTIAGIWLIRVIGIYLLCFILDWGIAGVWLVNLIDYMVRSVYLLEKFKKLLLCRK